MTDSCDILIVGGGQVGLTLAVALASSAAALRVGLIDRRPLDPPVDDGRTSAVAAAARRMFERLDVWPAVAGAAQPITDMIVTDSGLNDTIRPKLLSFGGDVEAGEPFAHMVENITLTSTLLDRARATGVRLLPPGSVCGLSLTGDAATVTLADGRTLAAGLVVASDGAKSQLRTMAGIRALEVEYDQAAIVLTLAHERPHDGRAEEHFLPAGPFAVLPLTDDAEGRHRSSLVWTESREDARRLVTGDRFSLQIELERRFGLKLGRITILTEPRAFPLGLILARDWVRPHFALAGDAAHFIHPIAGQGLNLGLRDAAALAELVVEAHRLGLPPGRLEHLERYERWRRFDTVEMGVTTDILDRLFSNDIAPVRALRSVGLGLVDRLPALKRHFIREASGLAGVIPRLMQGRPI